MRRQGCRGAACGGNAPVLGRTPIRLYTEPDVHWWMEERNLDYHAMNSVDHATLINLLRIGGNARAELITTTGKGDRPDGRRHPHSWPIVDEPDRLAWLLVSLLPPVTRAWARRRARAALAGMGSVLRAGDVVYIPAHTVIAGRNTRAEEAVVIVDFSGTGAGRPLTVSGLRTTERLRSD